MDENGERRRLADYRGSIVVLEWLDRDCPFVKKHYNSNNMQALQHDARSRGAVWLTVSSTAPSHPGYIDGDGAQRSLVDGAQLRLLSRVQPSRQVGQERRPRRLAAGCFDLGQRQVASADRLANHRLLRGSRLRAHEQSLAGPRDPRTSASRSLWWAPAEVPT